MSRGTDVVALFAVGAAGADRAGGVSWPLEIATISHSASHRPATPPAIGATCAGDRSTGPVMADFAGVSRFLTERRAPCVHHVAIVWCIELATVPDFTRGWNTSLDRFCTVSVDPLPAGCTQQSFHADQVVASVAAEGAFTLKRSLVAHNLTVRRSTLLRALINVAFESDTIVPQSGCQALSRL